MLLNVYARPQVYAGGAPVGLAEAEGRGTAGTAPGLPTGHPDPDPGSSRTGPREDCREMKIYLRVGAGGRGVTGLGRVAT